ncbi:seroin-like [Contarinia nasturtii]|uniref:seroin-like n=1 Tax=Contarinia nasturtii TaxID=265458 RepID=UPI0012D3CC2F|nr:seroin-like [Contarinia nasturtii]
MSSRMMVILTMLFFLQSFATIWTAPVADIFFPESPPPPPPPMLLPPPIPFSFPQFQPFPPFPPFPPIASPFNEPSPTVESEQNFSVFDSGYQSDFERETIY